jgi:nitrate reductase delta subunit
VSISPFKLASVLLQYPTQEVYAGTDQLRAAAATVKNRTSRAAFDRFLDWLASTPAGDAAEHYVATFDLRRRCALYLTYYRYGDTRERGSAMLRFTSAYRVAGFEPTGDELPDYLPMVLDFAASCDAGIDLLRRHRADVELLRLALRRNGTPYADLVDAVCAQLPGPGRRDLILIQRMSKGGPPTEQVGIEPFAPPEYLTGYGVSR